MSILIDTSVWVEHFKNSNAGLIKLLDMDFALTHPMVIGELACGTPPTPRIQTLSDIGLLQSVNQASLNEVMDFIERERVYGMGCGLVDISLLASTLITPDAKLWTLDKRLSILADHYRISYRPNR
jgi:predicted nucleic acid-binding protein